MGRAEGAKAQDGEREPEQRGRERQNLTGARDMDSVCSVCSPGGAVREGRAAGDSDVLLVAVAAQADVALALDRQC